MRNDRNPVFAIALAISLVAHAAAAWFLSDRTSVRRVDFGEEKVVAVRLFQPAPAVPEPAAAPPPPPVEPAPPPPPKPRPVEKQPEPKPVPETVRVAAAEPVETVRQTPTLPDVSAAPPSEPAPIAPQGVDRDERAEYVDYASNLVERQQRYPRLARKRKITSDVLVEIEIGPDGEVDAIRSRSDAPRVLLRATEEAIRRAAPFRPPPGGAIVFLQKLAYDLEY
ncbi:MAG: TonB family protein [bacterium]|nr:TonB family protein [bacterium]